MLKNVKMFYDNEVAEVLHTSNSGYYLSFQRWPNLIKCYICCGRLSTSKNPETIKKVQRLVIDDFQITI